MSSSDQHPGNISAHYFKQFHSRINTPFVSVMSLSVSSSCHSYSTTCCCCRTDLSAASFQHSCFTLCKWFRPPGWKSLLLSHFTLQTAQLKRSNDWAYSLSMVVTAGGPRREDTLPRMRRSHLPTVFMFLLHLNSRYVNESTNISSRHFIC